jgi:CheY-like chemotaxis protein
VEFDDGSGVRQWEGTPQGPHAVSLAGPATSRLLELIENMPDLLLADLRMNGMSASRLDFHAAPRRIDVDPALSARLVLD